MDARYPYQPPEPERDPGPGRDAAPPWLQERLFDRRIVLLNGQLDGAAATHAAVSLITLDAIGIDPVHLHVTCSDGELSAAFAIVDAIGSMRAPVHAVIPSQAGGAALAVLAAAAKRLAYPHARLRMSEPRTAMATGTAEKVAAAAGEYLRELDEMIVSLAAVTGRPRNQIEDDLSAGRILSAAEARDYGLVDEVVGPPA